MCLSTTDIERKVADEDIIVFKIFRKDNKSLYQKFDYTPFIGKRYDDTAEEDIKVTVMDPIHYKTTIRVSGGFVHSFSDCSHAKETLIAQKDDAGLYEGVKLVIRKCIIPKGSEYYYGNFCNEYASKSLIIGEIVYE